MTETFTHRSHVEAPAQEVFNWHKRPGALERLTPEWEPLEVVSRTGGIQPGDRVEIKTSTWGIPLRMLIEHRDYIEGQQFRDVQIKGPFKTWIHTHRVQPVDADSCDIIDTIEYDPPLGALGRTFAQSYVRKMVGRLFADRHRRLREDLALHHHARGRSLTIAITGSHGLIGKALTLLLTTGGHHVRPIVRSSPQNENEIQWSPREGHVDAAKLEGIDAVVHLAGEPLFGRWSSDKKDRIRASRVQGTATLARALANLHRKPAVLISASAIGYYGNRGDSSLDESSSPGQGFLADVCVEWEAAAQPAADAGIRVVHPRFGVVLSPKGGALAMMKTPFSLGLGGRVGTGKQWMSWVTRDDAVGAIYHAILSDSIRGPLNVVTPHPVTNSEFTRTLGKVLNRPTPFPIPRTPARLVLGDLADEALFTSVRVTPTKLNQTNYDFRNPDLEPALHRILGR